MMKLRMGFSGKLYFIIAMSCAGLLAISALQVWQLRSGLMDQKHTELTHLVESALSIMQAENTASTRGEIPLDEAKSRASQRIAQLRYGNGDYFWINDLDAKMIMHPIKPELNGKDVSTIKDPNGKQLFVEFVNVAKRDQAGFVDYMWPKPNGAGASEPQPKLSRVAQFAPWGWIVGTGIYIDDLEAQVWSSLKQTLLSASLVVLVLISITLMIARGMARAMKATIAAMRALASGQLDVILPGLKRQDEIGEIARAVEQFKLRANEQAHADAHEKELRTQAEMDARKLEMVRLASQFELAIGGIVDTVALTSAQLTDAASEMTQTAHQTGSLSAEVVRATTEASANVQSVAAATEELSASVREVARQVQDSNAITQHAVTQAEATNTRISQLVTAANRIGDVVKLITEIAEQTNLLALNATIEAARAGDAGRGFAVVASEVKALATQTAKATEDINAQIQDIQNATGASVESIKSITDTISQVSTIAATIANAVEEQGGAAQEISRNAQLAASGTNLVLENITAVSRGAAQTGATSDQVLTSAHALTDNSRRLRSEVDHFLATVRAA